MTGIEIDLLPPMTKGAVVAALVALLAAGLARLLRRSHLSGAAAGLGLVAGSVAVLGVISASPRQLPERVPLLALLGLGAGLIVPGRPRGLALAVVAFGLAGGAWWMAGAPLHPPDLLHAAPVAAAMLAGMLLAYLRGGPMPAMATAWGLLAAALWAAAARGPQPALALAGLGALAGALPASGTFAPASRLPLALVLAALAAVPLLARGAPADIAAAAAPAAALLAGPWLGRRLRLSGGAWLGPLIAGAPAVILAWLLR